MQTQGETPCGTPQEPELSAMATLWHHCAAVQSGFIKTFRIKVLKSQSLKDSMTQSTVV